MKRVRGQALMEMQGAVLLGAVLSFAAVAGAFWWFQQGQLNIGRDLARQLDDARTIAQGGTINVQISTSNNQTTVTLDTGADPTAGKTIRTNVVQGAASFQSTSGNWNTAITFIVQPDGYAQIYGFGACPAGLSLVVQSHPSYSVSCDPLAVSGA